MLPEWQIEACERLREAIVRSAVNDYSKALRKSDRLGFVCDEQKKLEAWFVSKWGQFLSGDTGEYILERCRKDYKPRVHRNGHKTLPDDVQKKICADYKSGMRVVHIKKKYKVSDDKIQTALRRWGT